MQSIITPRKNKFEPIEVTFVIESKRELEAFLSVFNASASDMAEFANENKKDSIASFDSDELRIMPSNKWTELYEIYKALPIFILSLASFWNEIKTIGLHIMAGA